MSDIVERIRSFNRFYLPAMHLTGNHYLGSEYSATEARVLFEIYEAGGCNAKYIENRLKIDKGYLSHILDRHAGNGLLERKRSQEDRRSFSLFLTEKGRKKTEELIRKSNEDIREILGSVSPEEEQELGEALDLITRMLSGSGKES